MGKTRDLFKKIRDAKGTFHAKMGSIKDRNGMDLTSPQLRRGGGGLSLLAILTALPLDLPRPVIQGLGG